MSSFTIGSRSPNKRAPKVFGDLKNTINNFLNGPVNQVFPKIKNVLNNKLCITLEADGSLSFFSGYMHRSQNRHSFGSYGTALRVHISFHHLKRYILVFSFPYFLFYLSLFLFLFLFFPFFLPSFTLFYHFVICLLN